MRVIDGDQFLVRIFLGESDKWHHTPLARALLERLRREGFAGATVIHGVAGFAASSVIHTANLVELSADLPVLIEVVDDEAHVEQVAWIGVRRLGCLRRRRRGAKQQDRRSGERYEPLTERM